MGLKSDKFTKGRTVKPTEDSYTKTLSFTKFIQRIDTKLEKDKKFDIVADFDYYDIHCDKCLLNTSKVVKLYIMQTDELLRRLGRGELIEADSSSILVTCPKCGDINKITDLRNISSLSIPEHLLPELQGSVGAIGNKHNTRNKPVTDNLPYEVKEQYEELLNMSKANTTKRKELENYIKDFSNRRKQYKDKAFVNDIDSLDAAGQTVLKVEDIEIV
jgi:hypothetical protein